VGIERFSRVDAVGRHVRPGKEASLDTLTHALCGALVARVVARRCKRCDGTGPFRANRSAMVNGGRRIEWLRCMECFQVTRFETPL
jgi:hypothetical protein